MIKRRLNETKKDHMNRMIYQEEGWRFKKIDVSEVYNAVANVYKAVGEELKRVAKNNRKFN